MGMWEFNPIRHRVPGYGARIRRHHVGAPPGSLDLPRPGEAPAPPAIISALLYDGNSIGERISVAAADLTPPDGVEERILWIRIEGRPTGAQLASLGRNFSLDPLALEDVINRVGRPKYDSYESYQFVVLGSFCRRGDGALIEGQISLFLGKGWVISINEGATDVFDPIFQRLHGSGAIRTHGSDFLFYSLIDMIVDRCFPILDEFGDGLEALEEGILDSPDREARERLHYARRELVRLRRSWWPQRDVIATLMRNDSGSLSETSRLYMQDCHDHCVIIIDFVESYHSTVSSLMDLLLSSVGQRMNDIMKALTIIATIFMPLSFIAGLYGMNFDTDSPWNMPELHWRFGYFYALGIMLAVVIVMLVYFRRKRWL